MPRTACRNRSGLLLIALIAAGPAVAIGPAIPGWSLAGSAAGKYAAALDSGVAYNGSCSGRLASLANATKRESGTLMQKVDAGAYTGERIRFSAYVRTQGVNEGAALWMRVDDRAGTTLSFDNMSRRGWIRGTSGWASHAVVLDVPGNAGAIAFGVLLAGSGEVWIDDATLEPVSLRVPTTAMAAPPWQSGVRTGAHPRSPSNMNFEDKP